MIIALGRWCQNQVHAHLIWQSLSQAHYERLLRLVGFSIRGGIAGCNRVRGGVNSQMPQQPREAAAPAKQRYSPPPPTTTTTRRTRL
jgi:hypothetical protein